MYSLNNKFNNILNHVFINGQHVHLGTHHHFDFICAVYPLRHGLGLQYSIFPLIWRLLWDVMPVYLSSHIILKALEHNWVSHFFSAVSWKSLYILYNMNKEILDRYLLIFMALDMSPCILSSLWELRC